MTAWQTDKQSLQMMLFCESPGNWLMSNDLLRAKSCSKILLKKKVAPITLDATSTLSLGWLQEFRREDASTPQSWWVQISQQLLTEASNNTALPSAGSSAPLCCVHKCVSAALRCLITPVARGNIKVNKAQNVREHWPLQEMWRIRRKPNNLIGDNKCLEISWKKV